MPTTVAGRYRLEELIGRGGMGTVWRATDEVLRRRVAVKEVGLQVGESVPDMKRALREARSSAALHHPHVVSVFDVVEEEGRLWLVMEYVDGRPLAQIIRDEGPLQPERAAHIGSQVADGLAAAHRAGTVHRDVKPGNVLVDTDDVAKISDFGIARRFEDDQLTQSGLVTGTPVYFSPELARGADPHPSSDVWALGATLFVAVEGRLPYPTDTNAVAVLHAITSQPVPTPERAGPLASVIERMMDPDPVSRWEMADAAQALHRVARSGWDEPTRTMAAPTAPAAVPPAAVAPAGGRETGPDTGPETDADTGPDTSAGGPDTSAGGPDTGPDADSETGWATDPETDAETGWDTGVPAGAWQPAAARGPRPDPHRPEQDRRRSPAALWVAAGLVLVVALVGGLLLLSDRDAVAPEAAGGPTSSGEQSAPSPSVSPTPSPSDSPTPSPSDSPTPTSGQEPGTESAGPTPADQSPGSPRQAVEEYFALMPRDLDAGWARLAPRMQREVGRGSYDGFWGDVSSVDLQQVSGGGDTVNATLVYRFDDGRVVRERQRITLTPSEDGYLIRDDEVVASRTISG